MQQISGNGARKQALWMSEQCLGRRIGRLHRLVARRFEAELRTSGLTLPQLEVLSELALPEKAARPSDLARWLGLERSTISRNLDVLVDRGYVRAAEKSPTGRSTRVEITATGLTALESAAPAWERAQAWISGTLGPDAVPALDRWLNALDLHQHAHIDAAESDVR
ncbi:MAG: winged helix-turn-helix transcriptional regulator [Acidobacteria bacterium]|nr:winged helix-turn-helix transcriptional regulator [Acidobacteriota bacterium]